jgi:hypothetical protein
LVQAESATGRHSKGSEMSFFLPETRRKKARVKEALARKRSRKKQRKEQE